MPDESNQKNVESSKQQQEWSVRQLKTVACSVTWDYKYATDELNESTTGQVSGDTVRAFTTSIPVSDEESTTESKRRMKDCLVVQTLTGRIRYKKTQFTLHLIHPESPALDFKATKEVSCEHQEVQLITKRKKRTKNKWEVYQERIIVGNLVVSERRVGASLWYLLNALDEPKFIRRYSNICIQIKDRQQKHFNWLASRDYTVWR